ncbi:MAG: zf-HC2 domain-containing protein [Gemmatimonadetes bacterium]|nr:zf-HC2 domain-containing protein [Gemmatimonadota bacterium]
MMHHPRARLSAYLDGELPADEAAAVERHLKACTECARELAIMNQLGGAMRIPIANHRSVWDGVHRKITRPVGWLLLLAGSALWAALVLIAWWRAELTMEWIAVTGIGSGLLFLTIGIAHEQYREWKSTRYKDVER